MHSRQVEHRVPLALLFQLNSSTDFLLLQAGQVFIKPPKTKMQIRDEKRMRPERLELPTPNSEDWCSIQLSYGRIIGLAVKISEKTPALSNHGPTRFDAAAVVDCVIERGIDGVLKLFDARSKRGHRACLVERTVKLVVIAQAAFEDRLECVHVFRVYGQVHTVRKSEVCVERAQLRRY